MHGAFWALCDAHGRYLSALPPASSALPCPPVRHHTRALPNCIPLHARHCRHIATPVPSLADPSLVRPTLASLRRSLATHADSHRIDSVHLSNISSWYTRPSRANTNNAECTLNASDREPQSNRDNRISREYRYLHIE